MVHNEIEMKEKKDRIDTFSATKAAVEEGIVVGGTALFTVSRLMGHFPKKMKIDKGIDVILNLVMNHSKLCRECRIET